jgi:Rad3-related DNA helicase
MGRVMVAVYNGRLSEGVDLSANLVMCIGVPFPPPTVRMQLLTRKLTEILGDEGKARVYGYIIPATWSAVQAAGRSIRKPEDKAVVFLVDDRYKALLKLLPKWFTERIVGSIALNDLPIALGEVR